MSPRSPDAIRHPANCVGSGARGGEPHGDPATRAPATLNQTPTRYDLMACNLVLASIAALLMAAVGSSVKVARIPEGVSLAGLDIDLGAGAAVNPGVMTASMVIYFSMTAALLCVIQNRLRDRTFGQTLTSVISWLATSNCSRLRGSNLPAGGFRTWLPLRQTSKIPQIPASLNSYRYHRGVRVLRPDTGADCVGCRGWLVTARSSKRQPTMPRRVTDHA